MDLPLAAGHPPTHHRPLAQTLSSSTPTAQRNAPNVDYTIQMLPQNATVQINVNHNQIINLNPVSQAAGNLGPQAHSVLQAPICRFQHLPYMSSHNIRHLPTSTAAANQMPTNNRPICSMSGFSVQPTSSLPITTATIQVPVETRPSLVLHHLPQAMQQQRVPPERNLSYSRFLNQLNQIGSSIGMQSTRTSPERSPPAFAAGHSFVQAGPSHVTGGAPRHFYPHLNSNLSQNNFRRMNPSQQSYDTMFRRYMRIQNEMLSRHVRPPFNGADRSTIDSYSTKSKYKKTTKEDKSKSVDEKEDEDKCAICWSDFVEEEDIR